MRRGAVFLFWIILCFCFFNRSFLWAGGEIPRKVLAFYNSKQEPDAQDSRIHLHAEVILNHLGLEVVYHDILKPFPQASELQGFRGILTWFQGLKAVPNPPQFCSWMKKEVDRGLRWVILEEPGFFKEARRILPPECKEALKAIDVEYRGQFSDNPYFFEIVKQDHRMTEFERKLLLSEDLLFSSYHALNTQARVYLKMRRIDLEESPSDMIFTSPKGGFVHPSYAFFLRKDMVKQHWRIDPFHFFEEAFGVQGLPRPDVTTVNGRRVFYSHIDGDGVVNISDIDSKSFSAGVITKEILEKYPHLPFTASTITGYFDMREYQNETVTALYRRLFSLPNVEVASHGHAHPLKWQSGKLALDVPGYDYTPQKEIVGSVERMRELLHSLNIAKEVDLFLWTGDCRLSPDQLQIADNAGLLNMNGGGGRFDKSHDSISFLYPLAILRGDFRQIYAASSNENDYTNYWHGPYYGFRDVLQLFHNTETPVRIKPIDIYYHYYSGEKLASLRVLKNIYETVLSQKIFPLFASRYVRMVEDFFATTIAREGEGFRIQNDGFLKTIRFDHEARNVDLVRSRGVIGFQHYQQSLYIFLDEAKTHTLYLTTANPAKPYLKEASFDLLNFRGHARKLEFSKQGWLKGEMILGGMLPNHSYKVKAGVELLTAPSVTALSDPQGNLSISFSKTEDNGPATEVAIEAH